jgi:hypothetical protein
MNAAEQAEVRAEFARQAVILLFATATIVLYALGQRYLTGPDVAGQAKARLNVFRPPRRDLYEEWLPGVQREISRMEHGHGS